MKHILCILGLHQIRPEAFLTCNPHDRDLICVRCYAKKDKWGKEAEGVSFLTTPSPVPVPVDETIGGLNLEEWEHIAKVVWTWPRLDPKLTRSSQVVLEAVNENILRLRYERIVSNEKLEKKNSVSSEETATNQS